MAVYAGFLDSTQNDILQAGFQSGLACHCYFDLFAVPISRSPPRPLLTAVISSGAQALSGYGDLNTANAWDATNSNQSIRAITAGLFVFMV